MDPKLMESWYRMMAEAMRSTAEGSKQEPAMPGPDAFARWMTQFMSAERAAEADENERDWIEQWYQAMGVVPRSRYLELLERYEALRKRLEEAEQTIDRLRKMMAAQGTAEKEAQHMLDMLQSTMANTLEAQSEWMRAFTQKDFTPKEIPASSESASASASEDAQKDDE